MSAQQKFVCPYCGHVDDYVKYDCSYTEWGREYGSYDAYDGHNSSDRESRDGDTENYTYECPACGHELNEREDIDDYFYTEGSEEFRQAVKEAGGHIGLKGANT